jgi:Domain of unknown function (DUF4365)
MPPLIPPHRATGKAGVNAAKRLFDACNYVFQEVEQSNDFGKYAYVDLINEREVTGLCVALQIKSGPSFRRASGYAIPIEEHYSVWRHSSLPVAGIVYDADVDSMFWCNISDYLESLQGEIPASIPVSKDKLLDRVTLETEFKPEMRRTTGRRSVGTALLQLCSQSESLRVAALSDCFAVGRTEASVLILLRYLLNLLTEESLKVAILVLAHATSHPDIFWTKDNWIPEEVRSKLRPHLRWGHDELCRLFAAIEWSEWERGNNGKNLYMLIHNDPDIAEKMERVAVAFLELGQEEHAFGAMYLVIYWAAENAAAKYAELTERYPAFRSLRMAAELESILKEFGGVYLFE